MELPNPTHILCSLLTSARPRSVGPWHLLLLLAAARTPTLAVPVPGQLCCCCCCCVSDPRRPLTVTGRRSKLIVLTHLPGFSPSLQLLPTLGAHSLDFKAPASSVVTRWVSTSFSLPPHLLPFHLLSTSHTLYPSDIYHSPSSGTRPGSHLTLGDEYRSRDPVSTLIPLIFDSQQSPPTCSPSLDLDIDWPRGQGSGALASRSWTRTGSAGADARGKNRAIAQNYRAAEKALRKTDTRTWRQSEMISDTRSRLGQMHIRDGQNAADIIAMLRRLLSITDTQDIVSWHSPSTLAQFAKTTITTSAYMPCVSSVPRTRNRVDSVAPAIGPFSDRRVSVLCLLLQRYDHASLLSKVSSCM